MAIVYYPAFFTRWPGESGVSVRFPDLDGCHSCGDTLEEALRMAQEALALYFDGEEGLPPPTPLDAVRYAPLDEDDLSELITIQMVPLVQPGITQRYNITMDEGLMTTIDHRARQHGLSRSGFLAEAARRYLQENRV